MSRVIEGLRLVNGKVAIQRIFIAPITSFSLEQQRRFLSSEKVDDSVLGPPKIQSPFDNPRRVLKASNFNPSSTALFSDKKVTETDKFDNVQQEVSDSKKDETVYSKPPVVEPSVAAAAESTTNKNSLWYKVNEKIGYRIDDSMPDEEKKKIKVARNTFFGSVFVFGGLFVGFVWFCFHYGKSPRDAQGNVIVDEFTGQQFAWFYRILNSFKLWRDYVVEPSREVLLPDPLPYPYHQPKYTLVIEMKNVLVSPDWTYKTGYRFKKRPALDYFLDVVGYPNFEVVIYTSESSITAPSVVDSMDPKQRIMYKLYRDCTKYMNGHHVKDLNRLNRDLSKVIFIDFDPKSFQLNPDNVLRVPKWEGNMDDTELVDLAELLKTIHLSDVEDVRPTLQYYSQFDDPMKEFRRRAQYLAEQEQKKHQDDSSQSALKKYAGKLFGFRRHTAA
uniref:Mitochondrial import inner membrane translocase subunit TIM50 n=1 Tax=Panagrolaimus sp. JU765 TaxID=591449 RepID=A0AC34QS60_9BILA